MIAPGPGRRRQWFVDRGLLAARTRAFREGSSLRWRDHFCSWRRAPGGWPPWLPGDRTW